MVVSVVAVRNGAGEVVRNLDHHWERLFDPLTTHRGTRAGTTLDGCDPGIHTRAVLRICNGVGRQSIPMVGQWVCTSMNIAKQVYNRMHNRMHGRGAVTMTSAACRGGYRQSDALARIRTPVNVRGHNRHAGALQRRT